MQAPRALKYGRDFENNPKFQKLPTKPKKHLTGEIQDCTISFSRDLSKQRLSIAFTDLKSFLNQYPIPYVYLYQNQKWQLLRQNGRDLSTPADLRNVIAKLLSKKA
ncbi:hypothetical protein [Acetilactobacillus jinshanensis]|uniref:Uncharacterized protein n=1 Tax=Acetilactobacillus jinshanensis TaxID=1720083 RepID=A0A4P6ZK56_9LACO|nr:hypothetical protein [Acetilactobacillus jinshanensis]QBP18044.1 hypothetical protein ELX58_02530 [Acetilactobacillus jinshanensis]URL60907.1 hypothetical protein HGK75_02565 [uncultured bacterium]